MDDEGVNDDVDDGDGWKNKTIINLWLFTYYMYILNETVCQYDKIWQQAQAWSWYCYAHDEIYAKLKYISSKKIHYID